MTKIIFYLFALILVFSATRVITVRNPVHAALFLVLAFFSSAAIWLLLHAEFLAIILVLVYVGAVMVLFLFVVMMLDINITRSREGFASYLPIGSFVGVIILVEMLLVVWGWKSDTGTTLSSMTEVSNTESLGNLLYTVYSYPFEIAAAILLVAMVAAILLTMRPKRQNKTQRPEQQVRAHRADRVRLVNMPAEPRD